MRDAGSDAVADSGEAWVGAWVNHGCTFLLVGAQTNRLRRLCVKMVEMSMKRVGAFVGTLMVLGLALAACGGAEPRGTVSGTARVQTGGVEVATVPGHGEVTIRHGGRLVASTKAASGHKFALSVPPGSYEISLRCPQPVTPISVAFGVESVHIRVVPNRTSHVDLQCFITPGVG